MDLKEIFKDVKNKNKLKGAINRLAEEIRQEELAALKAMGKFPLDAYKPFPKQEFFHKSLKNIRLVTGGNSSGKTLMGAIESSWYLTKTHPFKPDWNSKKIPIHGLVVVEDTKQAKAPGGAQTKIIASIPPELVSHMSFTKDGLDRILMKDGGSLTLRSAKAGRASIQGGRYSFVWVDENCIKTADYYDELLARLPDDGKICQIIITATLNLDAAKDAFIDEVLIPNFENNGSQDIEVFQISLFDNPHVEQETKNFLLRNFAGDADQVSARLDGEYKKKSGLIYNFVTSKHMIPPVSKDHLKAHAKAIFRIIDPHPVKPIAVSFIAVMDDGAIIHYNELFFDGLVKDVANKMKLICDGMGHLIKKTILDYSANTKSRESGKSVRDEFLSHGISCVNCVKDVTIGINYVRELLHYDDKENITPALYVTSNCINTVREFKKYRENGKTGEPVKKDDEFMDNLRYFASDTDAQFYFLKRDKKFRPVLGARVLKENTIKMEGQNDARLRRVAKRQERYTKGIGGGVGR